MQNDETIALLTEIRDLQKQHAEDYKEALKNQQIALELQANAARLQKRSVVVLLVVVVLAVVVAVVAGLAK